MIVGKIYIDENNEYMHFEVSRKNAEKYIEYANNFLDSLGNECTQPFTYIRFTSNMIIGKKAMDTLKSLVETDSNLTKVSHFRGDFQILTVGNRYIDGIVGVIAFKPDDINEPFKKVYKLGDIFNLCTRSGFDHEALYPLHVLDDDIVKNIDISEPISKESIISKSK